MNTDIIERVKQHLNDIDEMVEKWWEEEPDEYALSCMNAIMIKKYELGKEVILSDNYYDKENEIFDDMMQLDKVYLVKKNSNFYKIIKNYALNNQKNINEILINATDKISNICGVGYDYDSVVFTEIKLKNITLDLNSFE